MTTTRTRPLLAPAKSRGDGYATGAGDKMAEAGARTPAIWLILIAAFLDMMAMGIVMPVLPELIENLTGSLSAAGIWTGAIGSLWALMQFELWYRAHAVPGGQVVAEARCPVPSTRA